MKSAKYFSHACVVIGRPVAWSIGGRLRAIVKDVYGVKPDGNGNIVIQYQNVKGNALASGISILP
jgi:hypothetical protein